MNRPLIKEDIQISNKYMKKQAHPPPLVLRKCILKSKWDIIFWRRKWQPTPVFLPGKSQGQRRLAGYSPWGHKELDTTWWLSTHPRLRYHSTSTRMTLIKKTGNAKCRKKQRNWKRLRLSEYKMVQFDSFLIKSDTYHTDQQFYSWISS